MKDADARSITFYAFQGASEDPKTKKFILPDLLGLSNICIDPGEDAPGLDLPLQWPRSPPEEEVASALPG